MRARCTAILVPIALALSLGAGRAHADASGIAMQLFNEGRALMNGGDCERARAKFVESARLDPKVGTLASLAQCEEQLHHLVQARARWQQARELAIAGHDPRRTLTEQEIARLDMMVPRLRIVLAGTPMAPGLAVRVDDVDVTSDMLERPFAVDPGRHAVTATLAGKRPWATSVRAEADGRVTEVVVGPLVDEISSTSSRPSPAAPAPLGTRTDTEGPPTPQEPAARGWGAQRTVGLLVTGLGGAGLAVGLALGTRTLVLKQARSHYCDPGNVCDAEGVSIDQQARTAATASTITVVAGAAVLAAGVVLVLTAPSNPVRVGVSLDPGGAGLRVGGQW
jgi:hypothetical protein